MKIDRNQLLKEIIDFSQIESGVIVGIPGVGKSYLLSELVHELISQKIPATMLRLDFLSDGTDADINKMLGIKEANWIEALIEINLPAEKKGVLIFDSYDSIRDEKLKSVLLSQVARAKRELFNWSILVSVRTYDAAKSQKLIELFPPEYNYDNIHCRRFIIPVLSNAELHTYLLCNEKINSVYQDGTQQLKEILTIPFFLSLLNVILNKTDTSIELIKALKSEIELLEMYWTKLIYKLQPSVQIELFLKKFTSTMVERRSLSVDKLDYLEELNTESVLIAEGLLSENLLVELGTYSSRIGFSHNILFDYAVSKLILKDNSRELITFITIDPTRPFFLRPSFIYLLTRLWYSEQLKFWSLYNKLIQNDDKVISLFIKLIPSAVIAKEFDKITQLEFLKNRGKYSIVQISNVLQALRFLDNTANKAAQVNLLLELSLKIQTVFTFDFIILLDGLIDNPTVKSSEELFATCGQISRNLMDFFIDNRSIQGVDKLASYHGINFITKTYSTDIEKSRYYLSNTLNMLSQPGFNITYFTTLTNNIEQVCNIDSEFCATIYSTIFTHEESSLDPVHMFNSILMRFESNRRDQFESCRFALLQFFPKFLKYNPEIAIVIGLNITNHFIEKKNENVVLTSDYINIPLDFSVNKILAHYISDLSYFWGELSTQIEEVPHTKLIIEYLEQLINENKDILLTSSINQYIAYANSAYNWKMLLELGSRKPIALSGILFELLLQPSILIFEDTIVAAGSFLESASFYYNDEQLLQIEHRILEISNYASESGLQVAESSILRLLNRIPLDRLREDKSIALISTSEKIVNEPLVKFSTTFGTFTTEMFLEEQGVDIQSNENVILLEENRKMDSFKYQFLNEVPNRELYSTPLQIAFETFEVLNNNNNIPLLLKQTLLINISAVCEAVLRSELKMHYKEPLSHNYYSKIKEIIMYCMAYHTTSDTFAEENSSPGSVFSPTAKNHAVSCLLKFYALTVDEGLLPIIKAFTKDKNAINRMYIMQYLSLLYPDKKDLFWEIINSRIVEEDDWFIKAIIIENINDFKFLSNEPDLFIEAFQKAKEEILLIPNGKNTFLDKFLTTLLVFFRATDDLRIKTILTECIEKKLSIGTVMVFQAFKLIEPENYYRNFGNLKDVQKSQRIFNILYNLLEKCEMVLSLNQPDESNNDEIKYSLGIINSLILRIYTSMQINEYSIRMDRKKITSSEKEQFYFLSKPLLEKIMNISHQLDGGYIQGQSAHYFIEIMGEALQFDSYYSLATTSEITSMAFRSNYTFDNSAIRKIVEYTEKLLADHKEMLIEPDVFVQVTDLLDIYVQSGWPSALALMWRLDDIFR